MNKFKSLWLDQDANRAYPTLAAARQDLCELANDPNYDWYFVGLCLFHEVNEKTVSMVRVEKTTKGRVTFSRPQLL